MSSDGFPEVQRFSSLLNYLNLCQADVTINTETLDGSITKRENNCWVVQDEDQELTAVQIVEKIRLLIGEDEPERNLDNTFILIQPVDKITIKREIAAAGDDSDSEGEPRVAMKIAEIDLTGEEPIETATFDGGMIVPEQVCFAIFESVPA